MLRYLFIIGLLFSNSVGVAAAQCVRDSNYLKCLEERAKVRSAPRENAAVCTCLTPRNQDIGCCDSRASGALDQSCNTQFDTVNYTCGQRRPIECCSK